ncbi:beta-ketoacyl-ACP synthase III [bacterium]|nr:beta-ketoacyl-ACP synthase III [bacterium]
MTSRAAILGLGARLPETRVTNAELPASLNTSDEWITERTGIKARHIASPGQVTSDLAADAAREAIEASGLKPEQIDLIIVATATPDDTMPSTAVSVQRKLGMTHNCPAFDIHAACSGFIYALSVAETGIRAGVYRHVLVIGAETFSRVVDWNDRGTCVLFGDGAGAAVLGPATGEDGILGISIHADGRQRDILMTTGGLSRTQSTGTLLMQGKEVFRHAVQKMTDALSETLEQTGIRQEELKWLVPHQANKRILDAIGDKLGVSSDMVLMTLDQHANTSAASIPLALHHAARKGRFIKGDLVAMLAIGAGLTWGSCIIRW